MDVNISNEQLGNASDEGKSGPLWCPAFSIEALCIIVTNSFTITTFYINKHLRKRSTYLLINLSVADLLVGLLPLPLYSYFLGIGLVSLKEATTFHKIIYHMYHYTDIFTGLASITSLAFISLERMLATVYPLRHRVTPFRNYVGVIISIWILNGSVAALSTYLNKYYHEFGYATWLPFSFLLSSLIIIISSYSIVFANFRACKGRSIRARRPLGHYKNKKLAKTLFIVSAASLLTWSPFVIITCMHYYSGIKSSETVVNVTKLLHYINSLINTIIYASRMPEFRLALTELVCKCSRIKFSSKTRNNTASLSMSNLGNPLLYGIRNQEDHGLLFMNHQRSQHF